MLFRKRKERADVAYYAARRLEDMAWSMGKFSRTIRAGEEPSVHLNKADGLAALEASAALVCEDCRRCILGEGERGESGYPAYLVRAFEQKGRLDMGDLPPVFQEGCGRQGDYLTQINRSLARAAVNLSWKNRFLESRQAAADQFGQLSEILGEFSRKLCEAEDITEHYDREIRRVLRRYHLQVKNLLLLEYDAGRREAYITLRALGGRCFTSGEGARLFGRAAGGKWRPGRDSRSIITGQYQTFRFQEEGRYRLLYGACRIPRQGETCSGDNYGFCEGEGNRALISLCDGMGSGARADRESRLALELTEDLLETGFSPKAALRLVNTVLLLEGEEQHPAAMDLSCIDLNTGFMEVMKLGAAPTFVAGAKGVRILRADQVPAGVIPETEPGLISELLESGDRILMVTDGLLEAFPGEQKEEALAEYLGSLEEMSPQKLAEQVLEYASSFLPYPKDDMTVLAAKIWRQR